MTTPANLEPHVRRCVWQAEGRVAEMEEKLVVSRRVAQDAESRLAQTQAELARVSQRHHLLA